jgi:hypothetical protein
MKYDDAFEALVLANPITDADACLDQIAEPTVFLTMTMETIDEMGAMQRTPELTDGRRKWKRLAVAIGAAAIVVAAVLLATALQSDDVEPADLPMVPFETPVMP